MGSQRRDAQTRMKQKLTAQLDQLTADLQTKGLEAAEVDRHPKVRHLRAEIRRVHHRLQAIDALETRTATHQARRQRKRRDPTTEDVESAEATAPAGGQGKGRREDPQAAKSSRRAQAKRKGEESPASEATREKQSRRRRADSQAEASQPEAERKSKKRVKPERRGPRQGSPRGGGRGTRAAR